MPTMHRLRDLTRKQVLCLLHNAHLDFFCDNTEQALDGKDLKKLKTHGDVKVGCERVCVCCVLWCRSVLLDNVVRAVLWHHSVFGK